MHEFQSGEKLVYPGQGLGEIRGYEEKRVNGSPIMYYVFMPVSSDRKVLVSVVDAGKTGLRKPMTPDQTKEAFAVLREPSRGTPRERVIRIGAILDRAWSGSHIVLAELVRELIRLKEIYELPANHANLLGNAHEHLAGEIAFVRGQDIQAVRDEILAAVRK